MRRFVACLPTFVLAGCMTGPQFDNPTRIPGDVVPVSSDSPILVYPDRPPGEAYSDLFEAALDAVDDFFPIAYANRYEGRILGKPTISPGFEQIWKPGSPDKYERALVTLQAYRYRCEIRIKEADPGGYFVQVSVRKELKDYPTPGGQVVAVPLFGDSGAFERDRFLVVDPDATSPIVNPGDRWIPKGRDTAIEQAIITKLKKCQ